jgi:chemotaxis protein CheD
MKPGSAIGAAADHPPLPAALPQFAHIRRAWDPTLKRSLAKLLPGEYYVTSSDEIIFTVLGSCVSACVRDRKLRIGGMNHFMLPLDLSGGTRHWGDSALTSATRYGDVAMDRLVSDILSLGGDRADLEFKVMGGGRVLDMGIDVGGHNAQFVRDYLRREGFQIAAEDLGDDFARKVYYDPRTGKVRVKRLTATVNRVVFEREQGLAPQRAGRNAPAAGATKDR